MKNTHSKLPNYIQRTGAQFETTQRFCEKSAVVDTTSAELPEAGVPMLRLDDNTYATSTQELHGFIIGDSGCGKTRRVIMPTIRLMAKAGNSMVISDPKGELYRNTSEALRKKGYDVFMLNFRNPSTGDRWNPLGLIEALYRGGDQTKRDTAVLMLKDIVSIMKTESESSKDRFWENAASKIFIGTALMLMEYGEPGSLTFENISILSGDIFDSIQRKKQTVTGQPRLDTLLERIPPHSPILQNLNAVLSAEKGTLSSMIAVYENMLTVYTSQEALLDLFSASEIDVSLLGKKKTALYIVLPDDSGAMYPIATVLIQQIYSELIRLADSRPDGVLQNKVTFVLDEFANFAKLPSAAPMLTAARSRGIRFLLVCQSMEQLVEKYEQTGAEVLLANCRLWIYMSCRNLPFLERLEKLLGKTVYPHTGEEHPLIDISELLQFEKGQILVLNDRCKPKMGYLPDYAEYDFGEAEAEISPAPLPAVREPGARRLCRLRDVYDRVMQAEKAAYLEGAAKTHSAQQKKWREALAESIQERLNRQRSQNAEPENSVNEDTAPDEAGSQTNPAETSGAPQEES